MSQTSTNPKFNIRDRRVKKSSSINYYEVFGIDKKATKKEIIIKYRDLVKKYHPDKNPLNSKIFEVIQRAWECLGNDEKRKQYDTMMNNEEKVKKSDHISLKKNFENFQELSKGEISEEKKKLAEAEFSKLQLEMDEKINYDRQLEKEKLTTHDTRKRLDDYLTLRTQDEIEYSQTPMFKDGESFNPNTFNIMFDKWKNKQKTDIIKREKGPSAFNEVTGVSDFTSLDNFGDPFGEKEDKNTSLYSSVNDTSNFNEGIVDISDEDLKKIRNSSLESNYDNHTSNKLSKSDIDRMMSERNMQTKELDNLSFDKFVTDPEKSFTFTHEVSDIAGSLSFEDNDEDDLMEACNKLIELEGREKGTTGTKK